jgi:CO/xanthine dehydrogenase Mo-binding subunit
MSATCRVALFAASARRKIDWALESQMDAAVRELSLDGLQIRLQNLAGKAMNRSW